MLWGLHAPWLTMTWPKPKQGIQLWSWHLAAGCLWASSSLVSLDLRYTMSFSNTTYLVAAAAKSLQSCPTLCDPIDGSPPGSPVPGILQARTLEWVAISFSNA